MGVRFNLPRAKSRSPAWEQANPYERLGIICVFLQRMVGQ